MEANGCPHEEEQAAVQPSDGAEPEDARQAVQVIAHLDEVDPLLLRQEITEIVLPLRAREGANGDALADHNDLVDPDLSVGLNNAPQDPEEPLQHYVSIHHNVPIGRLELRDFPEYPLHAMMQVFALRFDNVLELLHDEGDHSEVGEDRYLSEIDHFELALDRFVKMRRFVLHPNEADEVTNAWEAAETHPACDLLIHRADQAELRLDVDDMSSCSALIASNSSWSTKV